MDRRRFLRTSVRWTLASWAGFNSISKAFADSEYPAAESKPRLALIIDDIGYSTYRARRFLRLGVPLTFSILPRLRYSYDLALEITDAGHEVMLHQPMEPYSSNFDPGPGALYTGFGLKKVARIMERNFTHVPYAIGVNNHMGSRFTASAREIHKALGFIKTRDLFFIDSCTSSNSVAYQAARRLDMPTAKRNVFLDVHQDVSATLSQLRKCKTLARRYGHAIAIGHPHATTVEALALFLNRKNLSDIDLVHVSRILYA